MVLGQKYTGGSYLKIQEKLNKILNAEKMAPSFEGEINYNLKFLGGVSIRSTPSMYTITLEVTSHENKHIIVRLLNTEGKIERMFGWNVIKGANITTLTETTQLPIGTYRLDILDNDGAVIYNTHLQKSS